MVPAPVMRWILNVCIVGEYEGIKICNIAHQSGRFQAQVTEALRMVQSADPRRFRRIRRQLKYVANVPLHNGTGRYDARTGACDLDMSRLSAFDDEDVIVALARMLVHEATHGLLDSRKIRFRKEIGLRIERLCHTEEARFLKRVRPDETPEPFHEEFYRSLYAISKWQELAMFISDRSASSRPYRSHRTSKE